MFAQAIWANVKELIIKSSDILSYKIDLDTLFHVIDIIENTITTKLPKLTEKC